MSDNPEAPSLDAKINRRGRIAPYMERFEKVVEEAYHAGWADALAQQAATPTGDPAMPVVAYQSDCDLYTPAELEDYVINDPHPLVRKTDADAAIAAARQAATPAPAEPVAHMYPSDLERFQTSETFATAYSVAVSCPDERSVPLYAAPPATPAAQPADGAEALRRLWPIIEKAMGGLVFTADKAGEVAADMATVRAGLEGQG